MICNWSITHNVNSILRIPMQGRIQYFPPKLMLSCPLLGSCCIPAANQFSGVLFCHLKIAVPLSWRIEDLWPLRIFSLTRINNNKTVRDVGGMEGGVEFPCSALSRPPLFVLMYGDAHCHAKAEVLLKIFLLYLLISSAILQPHSHKMPNLLFLLQEPIFFKVESAYGISHQIGNSYAIQKSEHGS